MNPISDGDSKNESVPPNSQKSLETEQITASQATGSPMSGYPLEDSLAKLVYDAVRAEFSEVVDPQLSVKLIYSDDRQIFRIDVEGLQQSYVLKVRGDSAVKEGDLDAQSLQQEYDCLVQAWAHAESLHEGYSMSKPLALWMDHRAILLSGCDGENLNSIFNKGLIRWFFDSESLEKAIYRCGYWLGNYHFYACQPESMSEHLENRFYHMDRMLKDTENSGKSTLKKQQLDKTSQLFKSMMRSDEMGLIGWIHGNFAYRNVLYQERNVNLVDFEDARRDVAYYDVGQFIAEILFKSQFPWLRPKTKRLVRAFMDGYRHHIKGYDKQLSAYVGYHVTVHLYEHCTRQNSRFPHSLLLRFRIRYLSSLLRRWTNDPTVFS